MKVKTLAEIEKGKVAEEEWEKWDNNMFGCFSISNKININSEKRKKENNISMKLTNQLLW